MKKINREELKAKINQNDALVLIETLPPHEYQRGHLPGAINIAPNQIAELSASSLPDKSADIIVYCAGPKCHASEHAAGELVRLGYLNISIYSEGK